MDLGVTFELAIRGEGRRGTAERCQRDNYAETNCWGLSFRGGRKISDH